MQPLNEKPRKKAFLNFVLFFAITVVLIVLTAFFSSQVPFKDNERLREINKSLEMEQDFKDRFAIQLDAAISGLENVNNEKFAGSAESYDGQIQEAIKNMSKMTASDSISKTNKDFYYRIANAISACRMAKQDVREMKNKNALADEYKAKYDEVYQQLQNCVQQIRIYQQNTR